MDQATFVPLQWNPPDYDASALRWLMKNNIFTPGAAIGPGIFLMDRNAVEDLARRGLIHFEAQPRGTVQVSVTEEGKKRAYP